MRLHVCGYLSQLALESALYTCLKLLVLCPCSTFYVVSMSTDEGATHALLTSCWKESAGFLLWQTQKRRFAPDAVVLDDYQTPGPQVVATALLSLHLPT